MKHRVVFAVVVTVALAATALSTAMPNRPTSGLAADRVCATLREERNPRLYAGLRAWVWTIPDGCVYTTERPLPAGCTRDPDLGCASPPNVHVRFRGRDYVFHLTMKGTPAKARGIAAGPYRRLLVAHDGHARTIRERLFIIFSGAEFDGFLDTGPNQGQPDIGPALVWNIEYTLDRRKGLCCPRRDPGSPDASPFDVAPQRIVTLPAS
jgi:hypothetical protein